MCRYDGKLIKCEELLKAEAIVVDSCGGDGEVVKKALEFIDKHSKEVINNLH